VSSNYLILLSTFNGEKYIKDLLESLVALENANYKMLIRDDGSTDKTLEILDSYKDMLDIELHLGENVGVSDSFTILMTLATDRDFDYIAFCDQDDVWEPSKLERAAQLLKKSGKSLYASKRKLISQDGNYLRMYPSKNVSMSYENSIVENVCAGCTMVLKYDYFKEIVRLGLPQINGSYDHIIYSVTSILNEGFFDQESRIFYRIHSANAVGVGKKLKLSFRKAENELLVKIRTATQIRAIMGEQMSCDQKATLDAIIIYSKFYKRLSAFIMMPKLRQKRLEDIFLKIYLLLNQKRVTPKR